MSAAPVRISSYTTSIGWTTSEPSSARIQWGPAGVAPVLWETVRKLDTRHVITLRGLASSTAYHVSVTAGSLGQETAVADFSFTTAPAASQIVGSVKDGMVLVNGEPFFPLLVWQQCPDQLQRSLDAGVNLFAAGNDCATPSSTLAAVQGRALVAAADGAAATAESGLLGSFYPDEADARGLLAASLPTLPPGLRFLTLTGHFASMSAPLPSGRGMYPGLVAAADVVGFDFYPLQELCRRDLLPADFDAQQQLEALAPGKPTFQWVETRDMRCGDAPGISVTAGTIRAESWLALAGGAHGLAFFPPELEPQAASVVHDLAARIRQLEPALLQPAVPVEVEGSPDVRASARAYGEALYVIAVNAGTTTANVQLTVPGLGDRTLIELGTPTTLTARHDVIADRLGPLHVRIYVAPPAG